MASFGDVPSRLPPGWVMSLPDWAVSVKLISTGVMLSAIMLTVSFCAI